MRNPGKPGFRGGEGRTSSRSDDGRGGGTTLAHRSEIRRTMLARSKRRPPPPTPPRRSLRSRGEGRRAPCRGQGILLMGAKWFGASVKRKEDPALLTGQGRYVHDIHLPGLLEVAVLRSPHPHAGIGSIDKRRALALPGVHAVITYADLPESMRRQTVPLLVPNPAIKQPFMQYCLARDEVCFVGEDR